MPNDSGSGQFLDILANFAKVITPIVIVLVLIALIALLLEIRKFIKGLDTTVNRVNSTIEAVDLSIDKLQVPLNTVASLSHTIDSVHNYGKKAVDKSLSLVIDNYGVIKDWVSGIFDKNEEENQI